jgi:hypothetical protein
MPMGIDVREQRIILRDCGAAHAFVRDIPDPKIAVCAADP